MAPTWAVPGLLYIPVVSVVNSEVLDLILVNFR